jgi:putative ABC transport system substrate-binding protein
VKRRTFIAGLGTAAVWPLVARAQQPSRKVRIGVLLAGTPASYSARANALLEGLRDLGYEEGKTVHSSGDGGTIRLSEYLNWLQSL